MMVTARSLPTRSVDLAEHVDNVGFSSAARTDLAAFNIWSNSLPFEQLPITRDGHVDVGPVTFRLLADGQGNADNVRCAGQLVAVPPGHYDWIHLLAAAERRTEDAVLLHFTDASIDPERLRVSDFWPETEAWFGERDGIRFGALHYPRHVQPEMGPALWRERIPVTREGPLAAIRMPDNPAIHVFAMELQIAERDS
jgi:hypothetical protein